MISQSSWGQLKHVNNKDQKCKLLQLFQAAPRTSTFVCAVLNVFLRRLNDSKAEITQNKLMSLILASEILLCTMQATKLQSWAAFMFILKFHALYTLRQHYSDPNIEWPFL